MRGYLTTIEKVTGHAPATCPWRAFYEPIVREVVAVAWAVPDGNLEAAIGTDAPYVLVQAIGVYQRAKEATIADETRLRDEERKSEHRARDAMRKAAGRG